MGYVIMLFIYIYITLHNPVDPSDHYVRNQGKSVLVELKPLVLPATSWELPGSLGNIRSLVWVIFSFEPMQLDNGIGLNTAERPIGAKHPTD